MGFKEIWKNLVGWKKWALIGFVTSLLYSFMMSLFFSCKGELACIFYLFPDVILQFFTIGGVIFQGIVCYLISIISGQEIEMVIQNYWFYLMIPMAIFNALFYSGLAILFGFIVKKNPKLSWRTFPAWLKGAIVGAIVGLLLFSSFLSENSTLISKIFFLILFLITVLVISFIGLARDLGNDILFYALLGFVLGVSMGWQGIIILTIVGALIGFLIRRKKLNQGNKNQNE